MPSDIGDSAVRYHSETTMVRELYSTSYGETVAGHQIEQFSSYRRCITGVLRHLTDSANTDLPSTPPNPSSDDVITALLITCLYTVMAKLPIPINGKPELAATLLVWHHERHMAHFTTKGQSMKYDGDRSLAIYTSYRRYVNLHSTDPIEVRDRARFIGILEASVGAGAPNWWSNSLLQHTVRSGFSVHEPFRYQQLTKQMKAHSKAALTWTDTGLKYSNPNNHYMIPVSVWDDLRAKSYYSYSHASLADDQDSIYIVMHAEPGVQPIIGCIEKNTMTLRWSQQAWASGIYHLFGASEHYISLEESHQSVVLYGLTPSGIFVEQFSKATGQPMMRYSSELWNVDMKRH